MADTYTVSRPYAKAIFADALADATLAEWSLALQGLTLVTDVLVKARLINNPKVSQKVLFDIYADVIFKAISVSASIKEKLTNLIHLLLLEDRMTVIADITILYQELVRQHEDVVEVEVSSAFAMSEVYQQQLKAALEKRFSATVRLQCKEDASLIGGAVLRAGNWVMDGSVKESLSRLQRNLNTL